MLRGDQTEIYLPLLNLHSRPHVQIQQKRPSIEACIDREVARETTGVAGHVMLMLTPPFHFSIVAVPYPPSASGSSNNAVDILYRGSIPCERNFAFCRRLRLKTAVVLRKKPLKDADPFLVWASKAGVDVRWVKADEMSEEKLGMGRTEVAEVLKVVLDPTAYPLYLADVDGISHTTLVVACLRKLQGWSTDSIVSEIKRFEPDYDELPLLPFLTTFAATANANDAPFTLPPPPYPSWLWPSPPAIPAAASLVQGVASGAQSSTGAPLSRTSTISHGTAGPSGRERERSGASAVSIAKEKDRTTSVSASLAASPAPTPPGMPFPHPLTARKHPSMRLVFPPPPPGAQAGAGTTSPGSGPAVSPSHALSPGSGSALSRVSSRRDVPVIKCSQERSPAAVVADELPITGQNQMASLSAAVSAIIGSTPSASTQPSLQQPSVAQLAVPSSSRSAEMGTSPQMAELRDAPSIPEDRRPAGLGRIVSFSRHPTIESMSPESRSGPQSETTSSMMSREPSSDGTEDKLVLTMSPISRDRDLTGEEDDDVIDGDDEDMDEDTIEDDDDDEEDEEDEDDDQPASQYISALDLAGYA